MQKKFALAAMIAALVSLAGCLEFQAPDGIDFEPAAVESDGGDSDNTIVPFDEDGDETAETPDDDADLQGEDGETELDSADAEELIDLCVGVSCQPSGPCHEAGVCDPATGECSDPVSDDDTICDDGEACTINDRCEAGVCVADPMVCEDDGNPCTDEECVEGMCLHPNNHAACDDGDLCTVGDACSAGYCNPGPPKSCDDNDQITLDYCRQDDGVCQHELIGCAVVEDCVSPNECVWATCSSSTHNCVWNPMEGASCDDGNQCTVNDRCDGAQCTRGEPRNCDDDNECTDDACDPAVGCVNGFNTNPCDDGNACTTGDNCSQGECVPGTSPRNCDDGNLCTTDACDPVLGCTHDPKVCPADNPCAGSECNPATGQCGAVNVLADGSRCAFLPDGWDGVENCRCIGGGAIDCGMIWQCIDEDGDGRCNDGDMSCVDGDHKCRDYRDTNCDDNCPGNYNPQQTSTDCQR